MKIKVAGSPDYRFTRAQRGSYYIRQTRYGLVAQGWPHRRGKPASPYAAYTQAEFAYASHWGVDPEPIAFQTAQNISAATLWLPRDTLISAMYGRQMQFFLPDGTELVSSRVVAPNPQLVLDLVTDEVGSMLWRSPIGWIGIPPGNGGDVLTFEVGGPAWSPGGGSGGGGALTLITVPTAFDTTSAAAMGMMFRPSQDVILEGCTFTVDSSSPASFNIGLAPFDPSTGKLTADPIMLGPFNNPGDAHLNLLEAAFAPPVALDALQWYLIFAVNPNGLDTTTVRMAYQSALPGSYAIAFYGGQNFGWRAASKAPDTTTVWSSNGNFYNFNLAYALA